MSYDKVIQEAACKGKGTDLFFPEGNRNSNENSTRYAKAICATCPVINECLQYALDNQMLGIWGGTTEADRKAITLNISFKKGK